ncbi:MAG: cache domain-containing protein, partial [Treponema sp.]|nr:cache domain-containing protein [Treponema sp.]
MKIGVKLVVIISMVNLIGIGLLAGVTLSQSRQEIIRLADEQARTVAAQTSEQIRSWLNEYMDAARALGQVMEGYKSIQIEQRRDYFNMMMRQILLTNPNMQEVYANWSPNGLDGMDAQFANTPGTDETGRFISDWTISEGQLTLNAVRGFSWDMVESSTSGEYMLDPAAYDGVWGRILIANMGVPVNDPDTGALIGVIGTAFELSTLQTMVSKVKPFGDGRAMLFSSGGIVAAHSDPERLGKNMRESESDTFGPFLDPMVEAVTKGTAASFSYQSPQSETVMQYYAVPFTIGRVPLPWTLVVAVSRNTIIAPVYRMLTISLIIGVLTIVLIFVGIILTARSISRPIAY